MWLSRKAIEKIDEVLTKFPEVETFKLEQTGHSGIGSITTMIFDKEVNGLRGSYSVEISGVEDW